MAATSVITCPECGKKFKGREELRGRRVRCPNCGHAFIVPTLAQDKVDSQGEPAPRLAEEAPPPPAPAEEPRIKSALDEELEAGSNPYGVSTLDLAPRCPNCANELESADARICLHCGYDTLSRTIGKTKKLIEHTSHERFLW